jgi:hypothetical protein
MENYAIITLIISAIAFVTGVLLVLSPQVLIRAGEFFNRIYNLESVVYQRRKPFGILFVLGGLVLIYLAW